MERDVVCGMQVDPATAKWTSTFDGHTYYFCGKGCKAKFDADPARFLTPGSGTRDAGSEKARTPDPESRVPTGSTRWTCPMHPDVIRDGPGSCPKCGMALEPMMITAEEPENEELRDMTRRFWASVALAVPTLIIGMADLIPGRPFDRVL